MMPVDNPKKFGDGRWEMSLANEFMSGESEPQLGRSNLEDVWESQPYSQQWEQHRMSVYIASSHQNTVSHSPQGCSGFH